MKIIIYVFLVPLAVILLCVFIFAGFKALFRNMKASLNAWWRHLWNHDPEKDVEISDPAGMVETVTITTGTCDCCGRTFVGTTADKDSPLQFVKFMGVSRNICSDCLKKLFEDFNRVSKKDETLYSENAQKLKEMLDKLDNRNNQS